MNYFIVCLLLVVMFYSPFHCGSSAYQTHSLDFAVALPFAQSYQNYKTLPSLSLEHFNNAVLPTRGVYHYNKTVLEFLTSHKDFNPILTSFLILSF